ncbi:TD and POZ domain-containing protein 3-like [Uloborus diversus]|uniref:TD and POZ domain-containing protein 3-like n=1 Tax=Uloborus diversus TaxID=327109 RepID=UPI00240A3D14|nr:TD and POZ domain-containing protein 3-like [Uloborus diversus]
MERKRPELVSLSKDLEKALENPRFTDVTLKVGTEQFPAHKVILMSRSQVFERMFDSDMKENQENVVDLVDVKESSVKAMLLYMYTGCTDKMTMDQAIDLYTTSDRYGILGLKELCKKFISDEIETETICDVAVLADLHSDEELGKAAKCALKKHAKKVFESQKWKDFAKAHPAVYSALLESTVLYVCEELEDPFNRTGDMFDDDDDGLMSSDSSKY